MAQLAPNWYVEKYRSGVLHEYQQRGYRLRGTHAKEGRIQAKKAHFPIAGKGSAKPLNIGSDLTPMNANRTDKVVDLVAYQAAEYIYAVDLERMSANEMDVAQRSAAMALGRKHDEIIIDEINTLAGSLGGTAGAAASAWDLAKALTACQKLQANDVPWDGRVFAPLPSLAWNQMLTFQQFSSSDYVGPDLPFTKVTDRKTWNGVHWFLLGDEFFPLSGTDMTFFIWHMDAIGSADNGEVKSVIDWQNPKTAWLANNWMDMAAKVLLPEGIIECHFKSDSAITVS